MNGETLEKKLYNIANEFNKRKLNVDGNVYYRGLRPIQKNASSYKEDIVVAFLTGEGTDVQTGTCLVNVYVPDVQARSGIFYADKERCAVIAESLEQFPMFANQSGDGVYFKQRGMIATFAEENIKQHFVSLKLEFKSLNKNY